MSSTGRIARRALIGALGLVAVAPAAMGGSRWGAWGQAVVRDTIHLERSRPEAQVMGYFAAVMGFGAIGPPPARRGLSMAVGAEGSFIPRLTAEQQTVGFAGTKAEETNFSPVFPRLRAELGLGERWWVEFGYVPKIRAFGVLPHMVSAALGRRLGEVRGWGAVLRASTHYGELFAAITCSADAVADASNDACLGGEVSDDRFRPWTVALEAVATAPGRDRRAPVPYAMLGVRRESLLFNVNYRNRSGVLDQSRLDVVLVRAHVAAGATWAPTARLGFGGELYYAPRALLTVRAKAMYRLSGRP
jgi:hypothetical protein